MSETIKWRRTEDGDLVAEHDRRSAEVWKGDSGSPRHPKWIWSVFETGRKTVRGTAWTQRDAKASAELALIKSEPS